MAGESSERTNALEQIVALAREHRLTASDISSALAEHAGPAPESRARQLIVRALGYLGGTFVFAGIAAFIALQWDTMNSAARVIITLGPGLAACVLAVLSSRDERFDKAVAPLFLIAAVLEPTGLLVAFNEFGSGGDARWAALITAGVVAVQFGTIFSVLRQSMLLFIAVFFGVLFARRLTRPLEVLTGLAERVAAHMGKALRPERVLFARDLPRTRSAKIMRRVIRAAYLGQEPGDLLAQGRDAVAVPDQPLQWRHGRDPTTAVARTGARPRRCRMPSKPARLARYSIWFTKRVRRLPRGWSVIAAPRGEQASRSTP